MRTNYKFYFTRQSVEQLTKIKQANKKYFPQVMRLLLELRQYPLQGRLLLNRPTVTSETKRLNSLLSEQYPRMEIREILNEGWLISYLISCSILYILTIINLQQVNNEFESYWLNQHS